MRTWHTTLTAGVLATLVAVAIPGQAQQVTVGNRFHTLSDSFYENNSINWSGNYRGFTFTFGGGALARPQFGGFDPSSGLTTNFAAVGPYGQIGVGLNFSQGYKSAAVTQAPSVTLTNGQQGFVSDTSQTPFVISIVPVVGAFPVAPQQQAPGMDDDLNPVDPRVQAMLQAHADAQAQAAQAKDGKAVQPPVQQQKLDKPAPQQNLKLMKVADPVPGAGEAAAERLHAAQASTAGRPALSVAEAKRLHQQEQEAANGEMAALMERARALEEDGKPNVAKIFYQQIAKHATGELQQQARTRLYELQDSGKR